MGVRAQTVFDVLTALVNPPALSTQCAIKERESLLEAVILEEIKRRMEHY
jgi:hypothetical protein